MRTKDFNRYVAACDYPGEVFPDLVVSHLQNYLKALGVTREIVRLQWGWQLSDHPSLERYVSRVTGNLSRRSLS